MMFVMNPATQELREIPLPPRDAAVNSLTALLAGLTGRLADPVHVNQVIDDILACAELHSPPPIHLVPPGTVVIEGNTKKVVNRVHPTKSEEE